ncbi:MAG: NADH-quinone oxidoreductase subunit I [Planctomycetes bacterium]|nr:NADH-quinone oxidoreductase subunit I [Planctomycetota bacterium]
MGYVTSIAGGFKTLVTGLGVTVKELFKKPVTLQYPHEKPELSPAYRSLIKLIRFDELGTHDCVACMQCVNICPSYCIKIEGGKVEGIKRKRATLFEVDFALCSVCGLCIDTCPTTTLEYSRLYDEAGYDRNWTYDLLAEYRDYEPEFREKQREVEAKEAAEREAKKAAADKAKAAAEAKKKTAEDAKGGDTKGGDA